MNARSGVKQHFQGEGILPGRMLLSSFLLRVTTRKDLLSVFTLCRNCIYREKVLMSTWNIRMFSGINAVLPVLCTFHCLS